MRAALDVDEIQLLANLVRAYLVDGRDGVRSGRQETTHHTLTVEVVNNDGTSTVTTSQNYVEVPSTAGYLPRIVTVTEA